MCGDQRFSRPRRRWYEHSSHRIGTCLKAPELSPFQHWEKLFICGCFPLASSLSQLSLPVVPWMWTLSLQRAGCQRRDRSSDSSSASFATSQEWRRTDMVLRFSDLCYISDLDMYLGLSSGFGFKEPEQINFPFFIMRCNWPILPTYTVSIGKTGEYCVWWKKQVLDISCLDIFPLLLLFSIPCFCRPLYSEVPHSPHL